MVLCLSPNLSPLSMNSFRLQSRASIACCHAILRCGTRPHASLYSGRGIESLCLLVIDRSSSCSCSQSLMPFLGCTLLLPTSRGSSGANDAATMQPRCSLNTLCEAERLSDLSRERSLMQNDKNIILSILKNSCVETSAVTSKFVGGETGRMPSKFDRGSTIEQWHESRDSRNSIILDDRSKPRLQQSASV